MAEENKLASRVLEIVKLKGPVIPTQISTEIGTNSILAAALLSELVSNKHLKISSVKVGGTPVYYAQGQEEKLQGYVKYLHDKEKKAYELLKSKLVLRDKVLEPVIRVALRQIKDFASQLNVQTEGDVETFWKWYMMTNEEAEPLIKKLLEGEVAKKEETQKTILPKPGKEPKKAVKRDSGEFIKRVMEYFSGNKIEVVERIENKKKTEAEFIISVPSPVGSIKYYCKAKDKKASNDSDLSTVYVQSQSKKMPALFLTTGKLTKKATAMLEKEFSTINVKQI